MKLIIEIGNEEYKGLVTEGHIFVKHIFDAVKNGTPIPDNATVCDIEQIRAEIEKHTDGNNHCDEFLDGYNNGMKDALDIIDKYK